MVAVGDIVYQVRHGKDEGRHFRVLEDHGATVLAQPLDRETHEVAQDPVPRPVQLEYDGQLLFDKDGNPATVLVPGDEYVPALPIELNASPDSIAKV